MVRPVADSFRVIQEFGDTAFAQAHRDWYVVFGGIHSGLDFEAPPGTKFSSALGGYVVRRGFHKGMGNTLGVRTGNILALYAHLSEYKVSLGDEVKEGQVVGLSGDTGEALTEPHLHFELRDLTKPNLKDRVFAPNFSPGPPKEYRESFSYQVRDRKSLSDLALKFFGKREAAEVIRGVNLGLHNRNAGQILRIGTKVVVPQGL